MGVVLVKRKTWEQTEADVEALMRDLSLREVAAQMDEQNLRTLAKMGESLNLSAMPLLRFLVLMGALYIQALDTKSLNVLRALTEGEVNLEGPGYELPF